MPARGIQIDRAIVLVGLMGAGKSTVGRRLAERLGLEFADSDEMVERALGLKVAEIFERFGESCFRAAEKREIARLADGRPMVVAAGGGAFEDEGTRRKLLERCITIWLDADVDILALRLAGCDARPLLGDRDPADVLRLQARERHPAFAEADIRIQCGALAPEEIAGRIIDALPKGSR